MSTFNIPGMYEGEDYIIFNEELIDTNIDNDDKLTKEHNKIKEQLKYFDSIPQYEQKSKEWFRKTFEKQR